MIGALGKIIPIVAALIALSPDTVTGQINVAPNMPNVSPPQVTRPNLSPNPDLSRVLDRADEGDTADQDEPTKKREPDGARTTSMQPEKNDGADASTDGAPAPPIFPDTLVKAMPMPMEKPWPDGGSDSASAPEHDGDVGKIDTDDSGADAPGTGENPPLGENDADRLRNQFRGGIGVAKSEEFARLKELQELGWLEFGDGAFGGDGDCGPGVNLPAGTDLPGLGCGGSVDTSKESKPDRNAPAVGFLALDPQGETDNHPTPSPDDGMGSNRMHSDAWLGEGHGSAKESAGVKDSGQGQAASSDMVSSGRIEITPSGTHTNSSPDVAKTPDPSGPVPIPYPNDASGGEAGQPAPRGPQTGGGAGRDCLTLGIRCDVAEKQSGDTWGEKMKDWARENGSNSDKLTPKEIMQRVGQPVPTDPWSESATGEIADPRGLLGLSPCFNAPVGCGSPNGAGVAADFNALGIDTSITGLTPPCINMPSGCAAGSSTATESVAGTSAGTEAR